MAGHSKWHNIRIRKSAQDARKGKLFTKVAREIMVAARMGGGDPSTNSRLRIAIQAARDVNMPKENIERAIKKGTGELESETYEELTYEGYGPHGVAILLEVMTDNRNRTVAELRNLFNRYGGNLGESGCVAWMFEQKGVINVEKSQTDEDTLMEVALEAGAEDIKDEGDSWQVLCAPSDFEAVRDALTNAGIGYTSAEVSMLPSTTVPLDKNQAEQVLKLIDALEEHDDVQRTYSNFEVSDEVLASLVS